MFYKLSNTAQKKTIEKELKATFEFSNLYKPTPLINGLKESNLPIITMDDSTVIKIGIWGLLPHDLEDNWQVYQNLTNTLNINIDQIDLKNPLYSNVFESRRCIVIVTGFFTSALQEGKIYPYHVHLKEHKPFAIAGVYNQLADGFISCSILVNNSSESMKNVPNMLAYEPIILEKDNLNLWLNKSRTFDSLKEIIGSQKHIEYFWHPVSKDFYDNGIIYNGTIHGKSPDDYFQ